MTKYYYDCPIKAAYMAKEFGMKFNVLDLCSPEGTEPEYMGSSEIYENLSTFMEYDGNFMFYVRPDSLDILKPKIEDLCEVHIMYGDKAGKVYTVGEVYTEGINSKHIEAPDVKIYRIIQRDEKPLISPKEETHEN